MLRILYLSIVTIFGSFLPQASSAVENKVAQRRIDALQIYKPGDAIYDSDGREVGTILDVLKDGEGNALVRLLPGDYPGLANKELLIAADTLKPKRSGGYETFLTPDEILELPEAVAGSAP